jgi:F0F1-type ATP synthase gamma subunit
VRGLITRLKTLADPTSHPLFERRDERDNVLLIIVTADRGLAGAFNANVIKSAETRDRSSSMPNIASAWLTVSALHRPKGVMTTLQSADTTWSATSAECFDDLTFRDGAARIAQIAVDGISRA